jgi:hypothetical protein
MNMHFLRLRSPRKVRASGVYRVAATDATVEAAAAVVRVLGQCWVGTDRKDLLQVDHLVGWSSSNCKLLEAMSMMSPLTTMWIHTCNQLDYDRNLILLQLGVQTNAVLVVRLMFTVQVAMISICRGE